MVLFLQQLILFRFRLWRRAVAWTWPWRPKETVTSTWPGPAYSPTHAPRFKPARLFVITCLKNCILITLLCVVFLFSFLFKMRLRIMQNDWDKHFGLNYVCYFQMLSWLVLLTMEAFYVTKPDLTTDCIAEKLCELKPSLAKENIFIIGEGYYENVLDLLLFKCRSAGLFKVSRTCTYTICIYLYRREGRMTSISIRLHFCRNYAQHSQHFHLVT